VPPELQDALELLGISAQDLELLRNAASNEEAEGIRAVLLRQAKAKQRKAAKVLHPDVNCGDADKTQAFVDICAAIEYLETLEVQVREVCWVHISTWGPLDVVHTAWGPRGPDQNWS